MSIYLDQDDVRVVVSCFSGVCTRGDGSPVRPGWETVVTLMMVPSFPLSPLRPLPIATSSGSPLVKIAWRKRRILSAAATCLHGSRLHEARQRAAPHRHRATATPTAIATRGRDSHADGSGGRLLGADHQYRPGKRHLHRQLRDNRLYRTGAGPARPFLF